MEDIIYREHVNSCYGECLFIFNNIAFDILGKTME